MPSVLDFEVDTFSSRRLVEKGLFGMQQQSLMAPPQLSLVFTLLSYPLTGKKKKKRRKTHVLVQQYDWLIYLAFARATQSYFLVLCYQMIGNIAEKCPLEAVTV